MVSGEIHAAEEPSKCTNRTSAWKHCIKVAESFSTSTLFQVSPKKYSKPNNEYNNNNNNQELEVKDFFKIFMWFFCPHPKWSVCFKPKVLWTKRVQGDRWNKIKEPLKAPAMHRPAPRTSLNANPRVRSWWWWPGSQVFAWKSRDKWQIQG